MKYYYITYCFKTKDGHHCWSNSLGYSETNIENLLARFATVATNFVLRNLISLEVKVLVRKDYGRTEIETLTGFEHQISEFIKLHTSDHGQLIGKK